MFIIVFVYPLLTNAGQLQQKHLAVIGSMVSDGGGGGCTGGSDGELIGGSGAVYSFAANCTDYSWDCTTHGIFLFSEFTPDEDGTITYAHFDTYDCNEGVRAYIYTKDGGNVTTKVCETALQNGTDAKPDQWDIAMSGECCLEDSVTYVVGIWCETDGDAYNGAYVQDSVTGPGEYAIQMDTGGVSFDTDDAESGYGTRPLWIQFNNSASR